MTKEEKINRILEHKMGMYIGILLQEHEMLELSDLVTKNELYKVNRDLKYLRNIKARYNQKSRCSHAEIEAAEASMMDNVILLKLVAASLVHVPPSLMDLYDEAYTKFFKKFIGKNVYVKDK
mgnify:CR=1 FL=1